jgi:hypothetical protein
MTEPQWLQVIVISGAVLYMLVVSIRAKKRNMTGKCAKCGAVLDSDSSDVALDRKIRVTVCSKCAKTTMPNHKVAYYFFAVVSVLLALTFVTLVISMATAEDYKFDRSDFGLLAGVLASCMWSYVMARNIKRSQK